MAATVLVRGDGVAAACCARSLAEFYGVAFAVANMSGFVTRACQMAKDQPDVTIDGVLHQEAEPVALEAASSGGNGEAARGLLFPIHY